MNSWSKWRLISISLMLLVLLIGCGPSLMQIKTTMQEQYTLPDNYTMVQNNPQIDRPVLVIQHPVEHPAARGNKKKSTGLIAAEKQMTENNRNFLIRRLFETQAFRQIMPQDDPFDPSLPKDILILEATQEMYISKNASPDWRTGLMETKSENTYLIRDPQTGHSFLTKVETLGFPNHKTGMAEFDYNIDNNEKFKYEIKSSDSDYFKKMANASSDALGRIINVITKKLIKEGY